MNESAHTLAWHANNIMVDDDRLLRNLRTYTILSQHTHWVAGEYNLNLGPVTKYIINNDSTWVAVMLNKIKLKLNKWSEHAHTIAQQCYSNETNMMNARTTTSSERGRANGWEFRAEPDRVDLNWTELSGIGISVSSKECSVCVQLLVSMFELLWRLQQQPIIKL